MAKSEFDTTKFVNIDEEDFTGYYNASKEPNGWTIKKGEERMLIVSMAEVFAKHLVDKILQKRGVKDSMRNTELRRSLFSQIIPELQTVYEEAKPLSKEDEIVALKTALDQQAKALAEFMGKTEKKEDNGELEALKKKIADLEALVSKPKVDNLAKWRAEKKAKAESEKVA